MLTGIEIAIIELLLFFICAYRIKHSYIILTNINCITYYWVMLTILTGIWEFSFITNYENVSNISRSLIESKTHVWTNQYSILSILPWNLAYIFYGEYGAYADREYMATKDDWSKVIEGTHAILCAVFSLLCIVYKIKRNERNYLVSISIAMGCQLMNSILYLMNYFIQCNEPFNVNFNSSSFPMGNFLSKRGFMYVNILWFVMPSYVIIDLLMNKKHVENIEYLKLYKQ